MTSETPPTPEPDAPKPETSEAMPARDPGGWAPYLEPGERFLWEGRPATGLRFGFADFGPSVVGLIFTIFSLFWIATAAGAEGPAFLPYIGALPLLTGLYLLIGRLYWAARRRARTRYALTDRRALIATTHLGKQMRAIPIEPGMPEGVRMGPESSLIFFRETALGQRLTTGTHTKRNANQIGFEYIADGPHVLALIRQIQAEASR